MHMSPDSNPRCRTGLEAAYAHTTLTTLRSVILTGRVDCIVLVHQCCANESADGARLLVLFYSHQRHGDSDLVGVVSLDAIIHSDCYHVLCVVEHCVCVHFSHHGGLSLHESHYILHHLVGAHSRELWQEFMKDISNIVVIV